MSINMYSYMGLYSVDLIMTLGPVNYLYKGCVDSMNPPPRGSNRSNSYHPCSLSRAWTKDSVLALLH